MSDGYHDDVTLSGDEDAASAEGRATQRYNRLGRYVLVELLGSGAMGIVERAYDPKLNREVALKQLQPGVLDARHSARMLREARAMAQLSHPNVVGVYDIEVMEGAVTIVMEYVAGTTLRQWLDSGERTWAEITERLVAAGRGLAAAHAAGLVHRDFKHSNVLVGHDGRVKVTDFGLAKPVDGSTEHELAKAATEPRLEGLTGIPSQLTRIGQLLGTPRYMAPELFAGKSADPRSDQYAFCIALWEALTGSPPFRGAASQMWLAKREGPGPFPRTTGVPPRIANAIIRGLEPDPGARWPSMDALLAQLDITPRRTAARTVVGLAVLGIGAGVWWAWPKSACVDAQAHLSEIWGDARRSEVEAAVRGTELSFAPEVWERVATDLDRWARAWAAMRTDSCEATEARYEQSQFIMDLRTACLADAQASFDAVVDVLAAGSPDAVQRAHGLVSALPSLSHCEDLEALTALAPPTSSEAADVVATIRARLADAVAQRMVGDYAAALESVREAEAASDAVDYPPVQAEVSFALGQALEGAGEYAESAEALERAQEQAAAVRRWEVLRDATVFRLFVVGVRLDDPERALQERRLAEGLVSGDPVASANLSKRLASVLHKRGAYEEATQQSRSAIELLSEALGPEHLEVAVVRANLGSILNALGRQSEAESELRAAREAFIGGLGPTHPLVADVRDNLSSVLYDQGRIEEGMVETRAALDIRAAAFGPDHPDVGLSRGNVAVSLALAGRLEEAEEEFRAAIGVLSASVGADHMWVTTLRDNLGALLMDRGDLEAAEKELRSVVRARLHKHGAKHPDVAQSRYTLGLLLTRRGAFEEAEAEHRAALEIRNEALGPESRDVGVSLAALAATLVEQGRGAEALPLLTRAQAILSQPDMPRHELAGATFQLAKLLFSDDPRRARDEAQRAKEHYASAGDAGADAREAVDAWLEAHAATPPTEDHPSPPK